MGWHPLAPSHQVSGFHGICRHHATSCYADCKSVGDAGLVGWPDETASWAFAHLRDADRLMQTNRKLVSLERLTVMLSSLAADRREVTAEEEIAEDKWLTRQELADRYGLPVKTPAEWASKRGPDPDTPRSADTCATG